MTNHQTTTASGHIQRAQRAEYLADRVEEMIRQMDATLERAIGGLRIDPANAEGATPTPPAIGISPDGDRCHIAEQRLRGILVELAERKALTAEYLDSSRRGPLELSVDDDARSIGEQLGRLRTAAGLSVEAVADALSDDELSVPVGFVAGVEEGRYRASATHAAIWAGRCGASFHAVWRAVAGRPLTEHEQRQADFLDEVYQPV